MATQQQLDQQAGVSDANFLASFGPDGSTQGQVASGASAAGSTTLAILGPELAAGPYGIAISSAVAAISMLSGKIAHLIDGCGQSCVQATQIVNQAETYVQQISSAYWQAPERTRSLQQYTLQQLDAIFTRVAQLCGQIPGDAGVNCVKDRLTRGYLPPWCVKAGLTLADGCGGWYDVTYDPIANDKGVIPDPSPVASVATSLGLGPTTAGYLPYMLAVLAILGILKFRGVI